MTGPTLYAQIRQNARTIWQHLARKSQTGLHFEDTFLWCVGLDKSISDCVIPINKHDVEIFTEAWCLNVTNLTWYIYLNNKLLFAQENAVWSELCVVYFRICSRCMISVKSSKHGHYEWWNPSQDVSEGAWRHNKSASSLHLARKAQVSNNISEK